MSQTFPFLEKIQDRLGYIVIDETGAIIKSDGELSNSEHTARVVKELLYLERPKSAIKPKHKMVEMTIDYSTHFYTIVRSGKYAFCVKRKRNRAIPPDPHPPSMSTVSPPALITPSNDRQISPTEPQKTTGMVADVSLTPQTTVNPLQLTSDIQETKPPSRSPSKSPN
ncbi:unnamed protein product, partial [Mesorhabditis belari]|uniref:Late endosomal/lysosomal adaptor and MAPK and MTOR activator 4 n=1 Tax=Mesorhabditis belari TaxID=2138241 RepID=A0AAF3J8L8_9BILA